MSDLKVTLVQTELVWEDIPANLAMFDRILEQIASRPHLIVLPEMFSTGFSMNAVALAEAMDGPSVQWLQQKARQCQADITGSLIIHSHERRYNRLVWAKPDGSLYHYDKRHLFRMAGEHKVYNAGQRRLTIALHGWRIRPFVCYDLRFPVWTRNHGNAYDVALFVANWPEKRASHWQTLLKARAIENQCYVVGVNRVGTDGNGVRYRGDSAVIDPRGRLLTHERHRDCTLTMILSRQQLDDYRQSFPAWMDTDGADSICEPPRP